MKKLLAEITAYIPVNEQEERDKALLLDFLAQGERVFCRENLAAHFTASGWVVSPDRKQVLLIYHNIYDSWSWMGGHADGETDLQAVALREVQEESGLCQPKPIGAGLASLEVLHVPGHEKRGAYVSSHLHLNVTYLFEADPTETVRIKPDENSGVRWFSTEMLPQYVSEGWMLERIYSKLLAKQLQTQP